MRAEDALILSKRFTKQTAEGGGAIKGQDGFSPIVKVTDTENGHLVTIIDAAGEHSFEVRDGDAGKEPYDGEYEVTPKAFKSQSLSTAQKIMGEDVVVAAVPYAEVSNSSDGITATIADK